MARAQRDNAAFNEMPGFVFGAPPVRRVDDGDYGDPLIPDKPYIDEDGKEWQPMNALTYGTSRKR